MNRALIALAVLVLSAPVSAVAGSMQVFEASVGAGNVLALTADTGIAVLNIDFDPSTAEIGFLEPVRYSGLGGSGATLPTYTATGGLTLTAFTCLLDACTPSALTATSVSFLSGASDTGPDFGSLSVQTNGASVGDQIILSGIYLDGSIGNQTFGSSGIVILEVVPEPGTIVLLGMALGGMAFLRRRNA